MVVLVLLSTAAGATVIFHYATRASKPAGPLPYQVVLPERTSDPSPRGARTGGTVAGDDLRGRAQRIPRQNLQVDSGEGEVPLSPEDAKRSIEDVVRRRAAAAIMDAFKKRAGQKKEALTPLTRREAMAKLFDEKASSRERRRAAVVLAQDANSVELNLWSNLLADPTFPPYLKAAAAEALGHNANPQSKDLVRKALSDQDETVVRGAIRGLSALGGQEAVTTLSDLLYSPQSSDAVKSEAVWGLGQVKDPQAMKVLAEAYHSPAFAEDVDFREEIVAAVGERASPEETLGFLQSIMDDPAADSSLRVAAISALQNYPGEVGPLVLKYLSSEDSDIREEAAWVLSAAEQPGNVSKDVQALLTVEQDPAVRRRLYQALENMENVDLAAVRAQLALDTDPQAKVSGYGLVLGDLKETPDPGLQKWATEVAIPDLSNIALTSDKANVRLEAVIALQKAGTPEAYAALQGIATVTKDQKILEAISRKGN